MREEFARKSLALKAASLATRQARVASPVRSSLPRERGRSVLLRGIQAPPWLPNFNSSKNEHSAAILSRGGAGLFFGRQDQDRLPTREFEQIPRRRKMLR